MPTVAESGFYGPAPVRRAITRAVLTGGRGGRTTTTAMGGGSGPLIVETILVVLNAVATGVAADLITGRLHGLGRRWRARESFPYSGRQNERYGDKAKQCRQDDHPRLPFF